MRSCRHLWWGAGLLLLLASACTGSGTYRFDVFPEMHYQSSYKYQEPPTLSAPLGSIPVLGTEGQAEPEIERPDVPALFRDLRNPYTLNTQELQNEAARLYKVNCQMCHGDKGLGNGPVAGYWRQAGPDKAGPPPTSFKSDRVRGETDGDIFYALTKGYGKVINGQKNQPPFEHLLSERERWLLVAQVRAFQNAP